MWPWEPLDLYHLPGLSKSKKAEWGYRNPGSSPNSVAFLERAIEGLGESSFFSEESRPHCLIGNRIGICPGPTQHLESVIFMTPSFLSSITQSQHTQSALKTYLSFFCGLNSHRALSCPSNTVPCDLAGQPGWTAYSSRRSWWPMGEAYVHPFV
jgi:hypothetical protein